MEHVLPKMIQKTMDLCVLLNFHLHTCLKLLIFNKNMIGLGRVATFPHIKQYFDQP